MRLSQVSCVSIVPQQRFSLQDVYAGGSDTRTTKLPCMITQASDGEWLQGQLNGFRSFRDSMIPKRFVDSYYQTSGVIESSLGENGFLRGFVYGIFEPIGIFLKWVS